MIKIRPDPVDSIKKLTPSPRLKTLYNLYLILCVWIGILPWFIPLTLFIPPELTLMLASLFLAAVIVVLAYIRLYYRSIQYCLTRNEIAWKRGVWFLQTGIVPYNRITSIDLIQGPVSRIFGLFTLKIQTAGSSVASSAPPALRIDGITDAETLRECIMTFVSAETRIGNESFEVSMHQEANQEE